MKLLQARTADGRCRMGVLSRGGPLLLEAPHEGLATTLGLFEAQEERGLVASEWLASAERAGRLAAWPAERGSGAWRMTIPVTPPEVWGAGVTYRRSADFREEGTGLYDRVYAAERPELCCKATAWRCAGPGEPIGRRRDSAFTAAEPELAVILGRSGRVLGYTLANDVSAWDIERENPLYLPQSKIYTGCFA